MKKVCKSESRNISGGFHWHCVFCKAGGASKAEYLRHRQLNQMNPIHVALIRFWE
jgi:hypothetical protein